MQDTLQEKTSWGQSFPSLSWVFGSQPPCSDSLPGRPNFWSTVCQDYREKLFFISAWRTSYVSYNLIIKLRIFIKERSVIGGVCIFLILFFIFIPITSLPSLDVILCWGREARQLLHKRQAHVWVRDVATWTYVLCTGVHNTLSPDWGWFWGSADAQGDAAHRAAPLT